MKLYKTKVTFEVDLVVAVDSEFPDTDELLGNAYDEMLNVGPSKFYLGEVRSVKEVSQLPDEWERGIPYGEKTDLTCKDILETDG